MVTLLFLDGGGYVKIVKGDNSIHVLDLGEPEYCGYE
jgi:hypothetical protein